MAATILARPSGVAAHRIDGFFLVLHGGFRLRSNGQAGDFNTWDFSEKFPNRGFITK